MNYPTNKDEFQAYVLSDPVIFSKTYFQRTFDDDVTPSPLQPFHARLLRAPIIYPQPVICYNYPTGYAKTTLIGHDYAIYEMCKNPNVMIKLITPKLKPDGEDLGSDIIKTLTTNERLIEDFGPFVPNAKKHTKTKWTATSFSVSRRTRQGRDNTIDIYGWAGFKPGPRANIIILDDIAFEENSNTPEGRAKIINWFDDVVKARKGATTKHFKVLVVGTPYVWGDIYHELKKRAKLYPKKYLYLREQAIVYENTCKDKSCKLDHPHSLWPVAVSLNDLEDERAENPISFAKTKMCEVYPREQLAFPREAVEAAKDETRLVGHRDENWKVLIGYDPATSTAKRAAFNCILVVGFDPGEPNKRYLIDMWRGKALLDERVDRLLNMYMHYGAVEARVEKNAMQADLVQAIAKEKEKRGWLTVKIKPHYTGRKKHDPVEGIESLVPIVTGPEIQDGQYKSYLSIPWGDENSQKRFTPLVEELLRYPAAGEGDTYDCIMALWFAELSIGKNLGAQEPYYQNLPRVARQNQTWAALPGMEETLDNEIPTPKAMLLSAMRGNR